MINFTSFISWHIMNNNNSNKRKLSAHANSPPPSKKSPLHAFSPPRMSATSPPHYSLQQQQQQNRPLTTAAAAVAAMKRGNNPTTSQQQQQQQQPSQYRRQSNSTAPPSRQGSVETDREGSVAASTVAEDETASVTNKEEAGKDANTKEEAEAEDDEKEDVVVDFNANMQAQMEKAKEDMKILLENFSDDQLQRYEGYRRSALNRTNVKRLVSQVLNQQCSQTMAFVVAGFSKVYVGEIVEKAKEIMEEWGDSGAIRPEHLREAHRREMYGPMSMFPPPSASSPKCCGCISLRLGCVIICLIWAAFSMYMAVLSFQNTSLFFTYILNAPVTVYGVANLLLSLVSVGGIIIFITRSDRHVHSFSHAIFVCVFIVLVDGFANVVIFITSKNDYHNQCIQDASTTMITNVNNALNGTQTTFDYNNDYYNCDNLWQDELKFGIIFYILQFAFYSYWALCIYSLSLVLRGFATEVFLRNGGGNVPMMGAPPPPPTLPPNAMINTPGAGAGGPFPPNDRQVIVLNNAKPASKTKRRIDTFSFRNIRRSSTNAKAPKQQLMDQLHVPFGARDSQFTIGFRLGPDGNIIDIENAPSPTPTFINSTQQQQLKRKPILTAAATDDDNKSYY